jgi:Spy/CpxP family protein refolding chaperone
LLPIGTVLIFALSAHAQQATTGASTSSGEYAGVPTVETQLSVLTEKLGLTADQQEKLKPILKDLREATEKVVRDKSLSREERLAKVRPERYKADERIRAVLNAEQTKKLDDYERGPHSEMHGTLSGAATPQPPTK